MKIPIDKIVVLARQRKDLGNIADLADSMQRLGQIHSIGVDADNVLIWGRRRLEAARTLGWTEIEAATRPGLTELDQQLIEFEEDTKRKDRTWQEECLACSKVFHMMRRAKAAQGEAWTTRAMASFTGMEKSSIAYMLQVGDGLAVEPRDDRLWLCENYTNALKLLIQRKEDEVAQELERRRQKIVVSEYAEDPSEGSAEPRLVQQMDNTAPDAPVTVYIHGTNKSFEEAVPDEDYSLGTSMLVLAYQPRIITVPKIIEMLRPEGYAMLWFDGPENRFEFLSLPGAYAMPWPLIWNRVITAGDATWPYEPNYSAGFLIARRQQEGRYPNASTSTVSAPPLQGDKELPPAVVEFSLRQLVSGTVAVMMTHNANPVAVAECGNVPIWFEPDPARFARQCTRLEEWYKENVPNVVIKYPGR